MHMHTFVKSILVSLLICSHLTGSAALQMSGLGADIPEKADVSAPWRQRFPSGSIVHIGLEDDGITVAAAVGDQGKTSSDANYLQVFWGKDTVFLKEWYGRTGNNLIQILHGVVFAQVTGVRNLEFPLGSTDRVPILRLPQRMSVDPLEHANVSCKSFENQHPQGFYTCKAPADLHSAVILPTIKKYLRPLLNSATRQACAKERQNPFLGLTVHLRSGDRQEQFATRAPCSLFEVIVKERKYNKIRIVTEPDMAHPCIQDLPRRLGHSVSFAIQSNSVAEDACAIMEAKHVTYGTESTFWHSLMMFNEVAEDAFFFGQAPCASSGSGRPRTILWQYEFDGPPLKMSATDKWITSAQADSVHLVRNCTSLGPVIPGSVFGRG